MTNRLFVWLVSLAALAALVHACLASATPTMAAHQHAYVRCQLVGHVTGWRNETLRERGFCASRHRGHGLCHVQTMDRDGAREEQDETAASSVVLECLKVWWLRILSGLLVVVLIIWAHICHVERLMTRLRTRTDHRIASALAIHDALLQNAQSTALQIQLAAADTEDPLLRRRLLGIAKRTRQNISEGRKQLESLQIEHEDDQFPVSCLLDVARRLATGHRARFSHTVKGNVIELDGDAGRAIRGIVSEMLVNAFGKDDATTIRMDIHYSQRHFIVAVSDNGSLAHPPDPVEGVVKGLSELWSLHARAGNFGGKVTVQSVVGHGVTVKLRLPGYCAYARFHEICVMWKVTRSIVKWFQDVRSKNLA
jgi:signal transduction histidine kinase